LRPISEVNARGQLSRAVACRALVPRANSSAIEASTKAANV
jgi:hypothetical protein